MVMYLGRIVEMADTEEPLTIHCILMWRHCSAVPRPEPGFDLMNECEGEAEGYQGEQGLRFCPSLPLC